MQDIRYIPQDFIEENTNFKELIEEIRIGFSNQNLIVPKRHHHDFPNDQIGKDATLLLMPAWNPNQTAGVKIVTVHPDNGQFDLPSIQGNYLLLDATNGLLKAILEAKSLTAKRTAATSALAANFLAKQDASSLLMIGTGALSINLIKAHASVRPIQNVFVWGRNLEKAQAIVNELKAESFNIQAVSSIQEVIAKVDIISCATLSETPLVLGKYLQPGQHIDLVGAYKPNMREADDEAIKKASVYIDTFEAGMLESGDIAIPLQEGIISKEDIKADLFQLCSRNKFARTNDTEITYFKSVGHAIEDLQAANYYYQKFTNE